MDFEKLVKIRNRDNAFAELIGLEVKEIGQGTSRTEMPINHKHMNPFGTVHGGCIATMADVTGGSAAASYGYQVTTMDCTIHYLRAGKNTTLLVGTSRELKHGRNISVYNVDIADQNGRILANATLSYMTLPQKIEFNI